MKKLLVSIFVWFAFVIPAYAGGSIGLTLTAATIDTALKDDIDSNGTTNTTKSISNDIAYGSIFAEATSDANSAGISMTVGVDYIPFEAEFDSRSTTQATIKGKSTSSTSGTNKGAADVSDHTTLYIEPAKDLGNGLTVFARAGMMRADVDILVQSVSSTNKTVSDTLKGTQLGLGVKKDMGVGFIKLSYTESDYDALSVTTSNNTKVTGDIDNSAFNLSFGKSF
tara:strand:- start:435 stop:1109 length:675 start_codon:yes stop_codon:yes gene_type:complete